MKSTPGYAIHGLRGDTRRERTRAEKASVPMAAPRDSSGVQEQIRRVAATQPEACEIHSIQ